MPIERHFELKNGSGDGPGIEADRVSSNLALRRLRLSLRHLPKTKGTNLCTAAI
jgi:hypothetical protein